MGEEKKKETENEEEKVLKEENEEESELDEVLICETVDKKGNIDIETDKAEICDITMEEAEDRKEDDVLPSVLQTAVMKRNQLLMEEEERRRNKGGKMTKKLVYCE